MLKPGSALLFLGVSLAACGGSDAVILGPAATARPLSAPRSPQRAAPPVASRAPARVVPCSTTASCARDEMCCVLDDLAFCTARPAIEAGADVGERSSAACAAATPSGLPKSSFPGDYRALGCAGSGDCGADEICVLGARAPTVSSCVKNAGATGSKELCGRGACKVARTACAEYGLLGLRTCEPTTPTPCGATACRFPEVCCAGSDAHCKRLSCSNSEGPAWACSDRAQCGEGQVCCLASLGQLGAQCAFGCTGDMLAPTCTTDAECPEIPGARSRCLALPDSPVPGVKACQVPSSGAP